MELIEIIKIVALLALIIFIICSIFMMTAFKSVITIVRDSLKSVDKFKNDLTGSMQKLEEDIIHLTGNLSTTLQNVDQTVKAIYDTVVDIGDLKDRVVVTLDNVDNLAESLAQNSNEVSDFKIKLDTTVDNFNHLAIQLTQTTDIIGKESIGLLRSFKPFFDTLNFVQQKFKQPYGTISTYFSAAYKAVSVFTRYFAEHKGYQYIKSNLNDIPIYTKDVDEQVHGPSSYFENDTNEYMTDNRRNEGPRASDDFLVVDADYSNDNSKDSEGMLNNTFLQTEELLKQAEIEIDSDSSKSEEERNELKTQITRLREDLLRSVGELKKEIAG